MIQVAETIKAERPSDYRAALAKKVDKRIAGVERVRDDPTPTAYSLKCCGYPMAVRPVRGVYKRPFIARCERCGRWFYVAKAKR